MMRSVTVFASIGATVAGTYRWAEPKVEANVLVEVADDVIWGALLGAGGGTLASLAYSALAGKPKRRRR